MVASAPLIVEILMLMFLLVVIRLMRMLLFMPIRLGDVFQLMVKRLVIVLFLVVVGLMPGWVSVARVVASGVAIGGDPHHRWAIRLHHYGSRMINRQGRPMINRDRCGDSNRDTNGKIARVGFCGGAHKADNRHTDDQR